MHSVRVRDADVRVDVVEQVLVPRRLLVLPGAKNNCILTLVMPILRRAALILVGIAPILLLALIFIVPALINVDRYRPQMTSYLQEKTGKQVEIRRLALTFFPVAIHIDHFGVKNPPIFPPGYIVQVARIDAELSLAALLHRQVVLKSLVPQDPVLNVTSDPTARGTSKIREPRFRRTPFLCPPGGRLGLIPHTLGSPRFVQMALHLTF